MPKINTFEPVDHEKKIYQILPFKPGELIMSYSIYSDKCSSRNKLAIPTAAPYLFFFTKTNLSKWHYHCLTWMTMQLKK